MVEVTPEQVLATLAGLSDPHDTDPTTDGHTGDPHGRAQVVATVATVCPDCGEDYDELGSTARCRDRHELRLTPAARQLFYRGWRADTDARRALTRAKRAAKAGDWTTAASVLEAIPRHRWGLVMVNRLRAATCATCAAVILTGYEDDRVAGSVRADPWRLTVAGEVAAIVLDRPTWRLWGSWPSYRAVERVVGIGAPPTLQADQCVVVAAHVCGTRLDGEPIAAAIAHTRPVDEIPF